MNIKKSLFIFVFLGLILSSCEDILNDPTSAEIADRIEGKWSVDEISSIFKSGTPQYKSALQGYNAYITVTDYDSTLIEIAGIYGLGDNVVALARVTGYNIRLTPNQTLRDGYIVTSGSGVINKNFKEITWNYSVDDGSGELDQVEATYTLVY